MRTPRFSMDRITPAYAGRTPGGRLAPCQSPDHPRVCGENPVARLTRPAGVGSPPRMRGEPSGLSVLIFAKMDHPRVCGENATTSGWVAASCGSPPRMRGELSAARMFL